MEKFKVKEKYFFHTLKNKNKKYFACRRLNECMATGNADNKHKH